MLVCSIAMQARSARDAHRRLRKGRHAAELNLGDCYFYALAVARRGPLACTGDDFPATDVVLAIAPDEPGRSTVARRRVVVGDLCRWRQVRQPRQRRRRQLRPCLSMAGGCP